MKKFKRGDRVRHKQDPRVGKVTRIKERGVAGCAVTYIEWIEIAYVDGTTVKDAPPRFEVVEDE
ncbi:MAG TPA: hypothetical protein EYF95_04210 [Flavobacteriales bacterium]|jgi:hypothetical protein|nr:hypothetical protein [Flavobacteriales bacterium]